MSTNRPTPEQFFDSIAQDARLLAEAARKSVHAPVPTCPGWTVRELVLHTGAIHRRKEAVVRLGVTDQDVEVENPDGDLADWFEEGASLMLAVFREKHPDAPCWTWFPPDQTAGFWFRRMAHETLIHRVDGELAHGAVSEVDPEIARDGIDEALEVLVTRYPGWTSLSPGAQTIRLSTSDRDWYLRTASYSGTSRSGRVIDRSPTVLVEPHPADADCTISGSPAALDLWLWGRGPLDRLDVTGDGSLAVYLRDVAAKST